MIQVRRIKPSDIDILLQSSAKLQFDKAAIMNELSNIMVVINENEIRGIGCGINAEDICLLNWIFIEEEYRRDHLGTALVKTILNNAELNGAKTAYISGKCNEFANSLKFEKVEAAYEINELEKLYKSFFKEVYSHNFFKTSLIDYFKPCSCK